MTDTSPETSPHDAGKPRRDPSTEERLGQLNRSMPFVEQSERGVLSDVFSAPSERLPELRMVLSSPEAFYHPAHRGIWELLCEMVDAGRPVTFATFVQEMNLRGASEKWGGPATISQLMDYAPGLAAREFDLLMVKQRWILRKLIAASVQTIQEAQEHGTEHVEADIGSLVGQAEARVFDVMVEASVDDKNVARRVLGSNEMTSEWLDHFQRVQDNRGEVSGIRLGIADLDRTFGGLGVDPEGDLLAVCAFPRMGKSVAAVSFLEQIAIEQRTPTLVFPLEMGRIGYMNRLVPGRVGVNVSCTRNGFMKKTDTAPLARSVDEIRVAPLFWDYHAFIDIATLRATVQVHVRKHGVKCVLIDHFGQLRASSKKGKNDPLQGEIEVMEGLHAMRRELGITVILCMQLNKAADNRPAFATPHLADVKGASEKTEYATHLFFINRPVVAQPWHKLDDKRRERWIEMTGGYRANLPDCWAQPHELPEGYDIDRADYEQHTKFIVCKNRHGSEAEICVRFRPEFQRFSGRSTKLYSNNPRERQVELPGF